MPHGPEHHLEEAEHAAHHSFSPFDRKVAMTMAIVAAALACVAMLSHRAHNRTLQLHIKANDSITEAANKWAYYQAKKNRQYGVEGNREMLDVLTTNMTGKAGDKAEKAMTRMEDNRKKWTGDAVDIEKEARDLGTEAQNYEKEAEKAHHRADLFDYGELGVQLALVLCSLAVLTKRVPFWYAGMGIGAVGFVVAMSAFLIH